MLQRGIKLRPARGGGPYSSCRWVKEIAKADHGVIAPVNIPVQGAPIASAVCDGTRPALAGIFKRPWPAFR